MSDLPPPETNPVAPQPAPSPEIDAPAAPEEAPAGEPAPDDGRPYDQAQKGT